MSILEQVNRQAETDAILAALHSTSWNRKQAARILKIDKSLLYKMKKLDINNRPTSLLARSSAPLARAAIGA
jgi:DNA-binding NtrC family response regulator